MPDSIQSYRNLVEEPWGRMFYDLVFDQLPISDEKRLNILDFGAGFCLTADHYAKEHNVIAVEPNEEMASLRFKENDYSLIKQGIEYIFTIPDNSFDVVLCHNVLEYIADKESVIKQLARVLKPEGKLSIIKHNLSGKVISYAVRKDDPKTALELLDDSEALSCLFGKQEVYGNEYLIKMFADEMDLDETYGLRSFFGLSSNDEIKYGDEWYKAMLKLEQKASRMEKYKGIAYFNHLIFTKRGE